MDVKTKLFRAHIGRNTTVSGEPWGFWFMWRPRPDEPVAKYAPIPRK